ncbi:MAG: hypothetical protein CMI26_12805 [Opitutae bacterium]|nr:hypothetical protein [Opitutae bacterium]
MVVVSTGIQLDRAGQLMKGRPRGTVTPTPLQLLSLQWFLMHELTSDDDDDDDDEEAPSSSVTAIGVFQHLTLRPIALNAAESELRVWNS